MDSFVQRVQNIAFGDRYHLRRKLGSGTFGNVYLAHDAQIGNEVAMKLEHHSVAPSLLEDEARIYELLAGESGFTKVYWHGWKDDFSVLAFELLGPNLEDLFRYCGNRFSLKTTLMLADQLLRRFETFHSIDYLHRDVKPENFLVGVGERGNIVYMTDLGLAIYRDPDRWSPSSPPIRDLPARPPQLLGTCRYASINGHLGAPQSFCDDLEALGYMLIYFMRGKLPWQGLKGNRDSKELRVLRKKQTITTETLCAGLPKVFEDYMKYVLQLGYGERPDYQHLRDLFGTAFRKQRFEYDNVFDWTILEFERLEAAEQELLVQNGVE